MNRQFQFPLKQHIGKQAAPAVVEGDRVLRGQPVALKEKNSLGANIYSSVTGVVKEVTEDRIVILADEEQPDTYMHLQSEDPLELIEEAGIVGLGGAGFPTYAKLSRPFTNGGIVIVNAAECEPILSHNIHRIEKHPEQLLRGLEIVMKIVHAPQGAIAIKEKHEEAIKALSINFNGLDTAKLDSLCDFEQQ